jgi:hypothetical protein
LDADKDDGGEGCVEDPFSVAASGILVDPVGIAEERADSFRDDANDDLRDDDNDEEGERRFEEGTSLLLRALSRSDASFTVALSLKSTRIGMIDPFFSGILWAGDTTAELLGPGSCGRTPAVLRASTSFSLLIGLVKY